MTRIAFALLLTIAVPLHADDAVPRRVAHAVGRELRRYGRDAKALATAPLQRLLGRKRDAMTEPREFVARIFVDGLHFRYHGGQVRSLLSLLSYVGSGQYRERYLGVKIPPTNLQEHQLEQARAFADSLAAVVRQHLRAGQARASARVPRSRRGLVPLVPCHG